jgi:hypothetical protein
LALRSRGVLGVEVVIRARPLTVERHKTCGANGEI